MSQARSLKVLAGAVIAAGSVLATALPAEAGASTGTWRNGMVAGPYGAGHYGRSAAPRDYYGGARNDYRDGYRGASDYGGQECYTERRRMVDHRGRVVVRRTRVCE
jgi:hypothetical protein